MLISLYGRGLANRAGIGRYSRELFRALLAQPRGHEFRLLAGSGVPDEGFPVHRIGGNGKRGLEEQLYLPKALRELGPDLYHNPDFTLPLRIPRRQKAVVTIHDVAYLRLPKSNSLKSKALLSLLVPWSVKRANAIITVSEFSKREIVDVYHCDPKKVFVTPNGVDPRFLATTPENARRVREKYSLPDRDLVVYVGGIEERKNLLRLALAVAKLPSVTLAIAGGKNRNGEQIMAKCREVLGARLLELGFFPDKDLPGLYATADVFAYPSLYEGFGIPPLEAMACGTVAAVSNTTALPEAVGGSALLFDPLDVQSISDSLQQALQDEQLREHFICRGIDRARSFSWNRVAEETMSVYETLA